MKELLSVVNEKDEIIGQEDRSIIHAKGLLHREVHVYFFTPQKEIIFQHRSKDKETFPDLLDATVGGHVEINQDYEESALRETEEEVGLSIKKEDLIFVDKIMKKSEDKVTGKINCAFLSFYLYLFDGRIDDLKIEMGQALGFKAYSADKLMSLDEEEKKLFIPGVLKLVQEILIPKIEKISEKIVLG